MGEIVMPLDVVDVHGLRDTRMLIEIEQVAMEMGVVEDPADIAFEVAVIYGVETHQGAEEPPVRFHDPVPKKESARRQPLLHDARA